MLGKVKERLDSNNIMYVESTVPHGVKLTLPNSVFITVFHKGTVLVQGKVIHSTKIKQLLGLS